MMATSPGGKSERPIHLSLINGQGISATISEEEIKLVNQAILQVNKQASFTIRLGGIDCKITVGDIASVTIVDEDHSVVSAPNWTSDA